MNKEIFQLPKEECNKLLALINKREWERAAIIVKRQPNYAKDQVNVPRFFDYQFASCQSAIHLSCALNPPPAILEVLFGAYPDGFKEGEATYKRLPLHIAVMFNMNINSLHTLIKLYPNALKIQDIHGRLPIHYACNNIKDEKVALALLKGCPECVHVADTNGFLPLHVACRNAAITSSSRTLIRMLIRSAPETILAETNKGNTAISCAKNCSRRLQQREGDNKNALIEHDEIVGMLERTAEEYLHRIPATTTTSPNNNSF